ncbi:Uma2 family endonuclease [Leptolyngbya sp. 15MV]|nr:Uma2 family endonuclease [Leptolyngbya sp. 15MV]
MPERARDRWTWDAYLAWEAKQQIRHEFVDGEVRAMTGGSHRHDTIANNLRFALFGALRGGPCRVQGPDLKIATGNANARYPDAGQGHSAPDQSGSRAPRWHRPSIADRASSPLPPVRARSGRATGGGCPCPAFRSHNRS